MMMIQEYTNAEVALETAKEHYDRHDNITQAAAQIAIAEQLKRIADILEHIDKTGINIYKNEC